MKSEIFILFHQIVVARKASPSSCKMHIFIFYGVCLFYGLHLSKQMITAAVV